jgi:microcystin-dependent protein
VGSTARLQLHYPELTDIADVPADLHTLTLQLDNVMPYGQGPLASRPVSSPATPGVQGRAYRTTDESPSVLYLDTGIGWIAVGVVAAGSIGTLQLADRSVTGIKIALATILGENIAANAITGDLITDGTITAVELAAALKPSQGAANSTEALRALGTAAGMAARAIHAEQHLPGGADPIDQNLFPTVPIGGILDWPYASASIPLWAALPMGQAISRATFPDLHVIAAASGYPHGAGDGVNTFNLPDYRGRVGIGKDDMGGAAANRITVAISGVSGAVLGAVGGSEGITLTTAQIPAHTHAQHAQTVYGDIGAPRSGSADVGNIDVPPTRTTNSTGGGGAHPNVQPVIVVNKIIRVK